MFKIILLVYIIYFSCGLSRATENTELPRDLQLKDKLNNITTSPPSCKDIKGLNFFQISAGNYSLIKTTEIPALNTNCTEAKVNFIEDGAVISITFEKFLQLNNKSFSFEISQNSSKCHFKSGAKVGDYTLKFVRNDRDFVALCAYSRNITNQTSYGFVLTKNESFTDNDLKAFVSQSGVKEIQNNNTIFVTQAKNCFKNEIIDKITTPENLTTSLYNVSTVPTIETTTYMYVPTNSSKNSDDQEISNTTNSSNVPTEPTTETATTTTHVPTNSFKNSDDQGISNTTNLSNVSTEPTTKTTRETLTTPTTTNNTPSSATIQTPAFLVSFMTILLIFQQYLKSQILHFE